MYLCIFNQESSRRSDKLHTLIFRLPARTFLVLFDEADSPPLKFLPAICSGRNLPTKFFFARCIPATLTFWRNLEESAPMLRVPLSVFDVLHFPEKAPKFPVSFILFFQWKFDVCFHWILSHVQYVHLL